MILAKLHRRKGFRYCSTPPPNPKNANATGRNPMAFEAGAGIRGSANFTNDPIYLDGIKEAVSYD